MRGSEGCLWGAFYRVTILLSGGLVELEYDPAASEGGVFPREGFRVEFGYRRMVISASPKSA